MDRVHMVGSAAKVSSGSAFSSHWFNRGIATARRGPWRAARIRGVFEQRQLGCLGRIGRVMELNEPRISDQTVVGVINVVVAMASSEGVLIAWLL